jgi:peroxiredoxin
MRNILIILTVLALGSMVWAQTAELNKEAPGFTLVDNTGKSHNLADHKGNYVVLEWINFECPFVRKHYDSGNMQMLQKTYKDKDVVWFSICSSAEGKQGHFAGEDLDSRISKEETTPTAYLIDSEGKVGKMYGAKTTPHMYIINPEGVLIYAGGIDDKPSTKLKDIKSAENYVTTVLDAALAGKKIPVQSSKPYGCSVKYK